MDAENISVVFTPDNEPYLGRTLLFQRLRRLLLFLFLSILALAHVVVPVLADPDWVLKDTPTYRKASRPRMSRVKCCR